MNRILAGAVAVLLVMGCVRKDTTHTFYLEPDGAVTWMALEKDIRSDCLDPEERRREEDDFLAGVHSGEHGITRALHEIGASWVETRILREQRPHLVVTEAGFTSIDGMIQSAMDSVEAPVNAEVRREEDRMRLMICCDLESERWDDDGDEEGEDVLMALFEDAEDYRLILTEGKFVDGRGFRIEEEGTMAVLLEQSEEEIEEIEEVDEDGRVVVYSLTWTVSDQG